MCPTTIDNKYLSALLKRTLDTSELLSSVQFKALNCAMQNKVQLYVQYHSSAYTYNNPLQRILRSANYFVP